MALDVVHLHAGAPDQAEPSRDTQMRRRGLGYEWALPSPHAVSLRVDYLRQRGTEFSGEFEVLAGTRLLHSAVHNLSSTQSRDALIRALTHRRSSVEWERYVEGFCAAVIRAEREGEPLRYMGQNPITPARYVIDQLVQEGKPNLLFGPGGGGKGYLAVLTCVLVQVGRALSDDLTVQKATPIYFDWEDDAETFNDRVRRVCNGLGVAPVRIAYKRMKGTAADRLNEMARAVSDAGATYAVLDSVSAAAGTVGRGDTWDTLAHRLFDGLDLIPSGVPDKALTWLLIGHVTGDKAAAGEIAGKMFGSIQNMNRARCAWELRSDQEDGGDTVQATLYHAKWNHTGRRRPIGLSMTFEGEAVRFARVQAAARAQRPTVADTIEHQMAALGPQSIRALSLALRKSESHIRAELNRYKEDRFTQAPDGRWDLAQSETETEIPW